MKKLVYFLCAFLSHASLNAQNLDSLFFAGVDTNGLATEIAIDEAAWNWIDTATDIDYSKVDDYVLGLRKHYRTIESLAKDLAKPFDTDEEKVRAIFIWMVSHIVYDYVELGSKKHRSGHRVNYNSKTSVTVLADKWEKEYHSYATHVLRKKRGICEGYSTLFYELCKYNNIPCDMVCGYASKDLEKVRIYKTRGTFPVEHAWNKVMLHDEWFYTDVTWASTGTYNGKRVNPEGYYHYYYLSPENNLFIDHIVNDKRSKRRNDLVGNY